MANFSDLYNDIFPHVPDCPEEIVKHAIRRTVADFCNRTLIWYEDTTANFDSNADYKLVVNPDIANVNVIAVFYVLGVDSDGNETPYYPIDSADNTTINMYSAGYQRYYAIHPDIIRLVPTPDTLPDHLRVRVAYATKNTAGYTSVPDEVYDRYADTIAAGVLSRLMTIPKKPYTNLQLARQHMREYLLGCSSARSTTMRLNTNTALSVEMPPYISPVQLAVYQ